MKIENILDEINILIKEYDLIKNDDSKVMEWLNIADRLAALQFAALELYKEHSYLATIQEANYALKYDEEFLKYAHKDAPKTDYKLTIPVIEALCEKALEELYINRKINANEAKTLEKYMALIRTYIERISQRISTINKLKNI